MSTTPTPTPQVATKGHVGLVVLGAVAAGLLLGLLLVLGVFAGSPENDVLGAALFALGLGFVLLAVGSRRLTDQPQAWAFRPGVATAVVGLAIAAVAPSDHALALDGWLWPVLLVALVGWSYANARRSLRNWSRRGVLNPSLFVLLLIAAGGAFQTVSAATSANPAPGRTYLVNGHGLYLDCVGTGKPTVVLFNGLGERTPSWAWAQQNVSTSTRVCTFDRAGEGWSGPATAGQDGHQLASDLHSLLRTAHVPGPYVLAGHSVGGVYALVYAEQYPRDVAGVALIDSATPYQFDLPDYPSFYNNIGRRLYSAMPVFAHVGLGQVLAAGQFAGLPATARGQARAFASSPRELVADHADFTELPTVFQQAKALKSLNGKPLAIVTASLGQQRGWLTAQKKLARLSRNSEQQTVAGATHSALLEDKKFAAVTSRAITNVVRHARSGDERP